MVGFGIVFRKMQYVPLLAVDTGIMSQIVFNTTFLPDTDSQTWLAYDDSIFARAFVLRVEVVDPCHINSHVIASFTNGQQDPACLV
jgi:hypothetical protein